MHNLSFDPRDPDFSFGPYKFSLQISTFENIYGIDPQTHSVTITEGQFELVAAGLTWAGGQEKASGHLQLHALQDPMRTTFTIRASADRHIRCVKLIIKNVPDGAIVNLRETTSKSVPPEGLIYRYPDGWRGLYTPLIVLSHAPGKYSYFRSLDTEVRPKTFVLLKRPDGMLDVELIFEARATDMGTSVEVPAWEIGTCSDPEEILQAQLAHVERAYALQTWETRSDVPGWARKIALVAAIHGQHNTGYIFNDYAATLRTLEWMAEQIDPAQVLVYLPGWEGRYYWQYGDFRPDARMGGVEGFARLMSRATNMGFHMMPMFGINVVNRGLENFEQWGSPAIHLTAGGFTASGSVDWDSSRHYDHGWTALLNPAVATWQNRLVGQIRGLIEQFNFDGVFLDISAAYWNDPRADVYLGTKQLVERVRQGYLDLLVAGEGWFDAMGAITPLTQTGHTEGDIHWSDQPYAPFFDRHNRCFPHLCLGDAGRGSTGVHELGTNAIQRAPLRKGIIPTITIVEDTLDVARDGVLTAIKDAHQFAAQFFPSPTR